MEKKTKFVQNENAIVEFHNDLCGPLYLLCPDCGLMMHCSTVAYVVTNTYINPEIIGKTSEQLANVEVSRSKDEQVIEDILYKMKYQT